LEIEREVLARCLVRPRFVKGYEPVVRQTREKKRDW